MERIEEFVDDRQKSWCIHCTRSLAELDTTEDHVPTKGFLIKPRPHNLPVVTICRDCNNGFSRDEQYAVTALSCVLAGSTDPEKQLNASAARALAESVALRAMIDRSKHEYQTTGGEMRIVWRPDMGRIKRVVLKNARGHAYFEYGEPMMSDPTHVWAQPFEDMTEAERMEFESLDEAGDLGVWPEVGSRMMARIASGLDMEGAGLDMEGGWVVVQEGTYRYSVSQLGGLRIRSVLWEYLATEVQWEN
ncbi:conserved hypothetical protein [Mesorhizobium plurifarium]|uniref:HNH endonuclease 5 domain-containing protein n=1 Tax=Mesorhizobium plurifarium TaxID=69974 RepID=A0A090DWV6_MESPL|nr:conserved hypothetical protein [Mesorhizobium plurifarium]